MKFQKTLLAAALAVVGFGTQAADQLTKTGLANAYKYQNADNEEVLKVTVIGGDQTLITNGWYTVSANGELVNYEDDTSAFTTLVSGGQLNINTFESSIVVEETATGSATGTGTNVEQNNYWSYEDASSTTTTTTTTDNSSYVINGQLVNYDENGLLTNEEASVGYAGVLDASVKEEVEVVAATVKKDVQIGNLTEEQTTANAQYNFQLDNSTTNVQGLVATIQTSEQATTSVAGVTGNGLAVLDVPVGAVVNLEKGTVTSTQIIGADTVSPRSELLAYDSVDGKRVVSYGGSYYTLDATQKTLTSYAGDVDTLKLVGAGTAEITSGSTVVDSVNTGLVSSENVTYGEKVVTTTNEGLVQVGSTNADVANNTSGTDYIVNPSEQKVTSKDVVTGIIKTDAEGNKTYGLEATNIENNVITAQTTVTAEGISTTGSISASDYILNGQSITGQLEAAVQKAEAASTETLASANTFTTTTATTLRSEAAVETTRVNAAIVDGDKATLASANEFTTTTATTLRSEAAVETARVNTAIVDGDRATLASAQSYTDSQVSGLGSRVNQLNSRVDDVEKTAYRGIAIALAAQQQVPNIQPGQFAVFGGVGHYEGESAGALGVVGAVNDRTSVSAAVGFAGGSEVGGRVGVAYLFGGK